MGDLIGIISKKVGISPNIVRSIVQLLDEGNTVPFIARYRKELTEGATDEQLRDFNDLYTYTRNLESRKADVIRLIDEKGLMTDELRKQIMEAETLARVEDLYRPFKEKKNTKATIAKAKGLEPLADILRKALVSKEDFEAEAEKFIKDTGDVKTSVKDIVEAIGGAKDIVAEDVSDHADLREEIKTREENFAILETKATKTFEENGTYKVYANYSKKISEMPSYAYLAVSRAEKEKQLSLKLNFSNDKIWEDTKKFFIPKEFGTVVTYLEEALQDGLSRLLMPSLEREIRSDKKKRADEAAIKVFGDNLKNLLLTPPIKGMNVIGFDPAFRTGCKLAVVDQTGKFLDKTVIYPTEPQNKVEEARDTLKKLVTQYKIDLIVIGNGTASRESEKIVSEFIKKNKLDVKYMITSESGASVYSASKLAQDEYPDLDVTIRGAISIAHRVQDPLAELTKIDPKAIGVGQYQHDVDQKYLKEKLDEKVEDVVNSVGVDVNTASYTLLQYIAGLSEAVAKNVVEYRDINGKFTSKAQIKKVKGLGPKAYEQAIGFMRIKGGKEILDETGIHPEIHKQVYNLIETEFGTKKKDLKLPMKLENNFDGKLNDRSEKYKIGLETLKDVIAELQRPGLDPRDELEVPCFASEIVDIKNLTIGMELNGVVRNVTDFGAFVDIGLHSDGLVHKSQMANYFVTNPTDVVKVGQQVKVKVLEIDLEREKVSLTMKDGTESPKIKQEIKHDSQNNKAIQKDEEAGESSLRGNITFS
ncbi:RNA-binding transcriptional accessory protein [Candidatus Gracilibacteria bacterium]|nr:RNA-binding transcriptional accessory protein [Candidatus Gracilibacteria bacterium]